MTRLVGSGLSGLEQRIEINDLSFTSASLTPSALNRSFACAQNVVKKLPLTISHRNAAIERSAFLGGLSSATCLTCSRSRRCFDVPKAGVR